MTRQQETAVGRIRFSKELCSRYKSDTITQHKGYAGNTIALSSDQAFCSLKYICTSKLNDDLAFEQTHILLPVSAVSAFQQIEHSSKSSEQRAQRWM